MPKMLILLVAWGPFKAIFRPDPCAAADYQIMTTTRSIQRTNLFSPQSRSPLGAQYTLH